MNFFEMNEKTLEAFKQLKVAESVPIGSHYPVGPLALALKQLANLIVDHQDAIQPAKSPETADQVAVLQFLVTELPALESAVQLLQKRAVGLLERVKENPIKK